MKDYILDNQNLIGQREVMQLSIQTMENTTEISNLRMNLGSVEKQMSDVMEQLEDVVTKSELADMSYNKLWKMLIDKGMKRAELRDAVDMSTNTLAKLDMKNLQTAKYNVDRLFKSEQSKEQDEKQKTTEQTL